MKTFLTSAIALLLLVCGLARAEDDFLDPQQAFAFRARVIDAQTVEARWTIADGYYLYHEKIKFAADSGVKLGAIDLPHGKVKFDETFNKNVETHRGELVVRIPIAAGKGSFTLTATSQGCADKGLCYPPQDQTARLTLTSAGAAGVTGADGNAPGAGSTEAPGNNTAANATEQGRIEAALKSGSLLTVMPMFFVLGLLLSFTPCVLPMIPILSSIIVGHSGHRAGGEGTHRTSLSKSRGFTLALAYALGMAIIYTAMGVAAGLAGEGLAAALQTPGVLITFAVLLLALSLSMFGFYELQLPNALQSRLTGISNHQRGGSYVGVFIMGAVSALIVGPCVAAPLAGALLYISQTRNVVIGGSALFAMAAGMSVPLLLVGISAGSLLPRAGAWMEGVKKFFGVLLIAVAIWMVSPVIPAWAHMLAWAVLFIVSAVYLRAFDPLPVESTGWTRLWKGAGVVLLLLGAIQVVGVATGGRDVLQPLQQLAVRPAVGATLAAEAAPKHGNWLKIASVAELDAALRDTKGRAVMLDFYADWCVSCKEMERFTFTDQQVAQRMDEMLLLQADVTRNTDDDKALLKRFSLFGPPGIIFFDARGTEVAQSRVIGFQDASTFLASIDRAHAGTTPQALALEVVAR